jgi:hypothetical protein
MGQSSSAVAEGTGGGESERAGSHRLGDQHRHLVDLGGGGGGVTDGAVAHDPDPQCTVGDLGADIHRPGPRVERIEVLGERHPVPGHALGHGDTGDVLDPFHQLHELLPSLGEHRSEPDTAVPGDDRGDAVRGRGFEQIVPGHLAVEVGVGVDETGGDHQTGGVDLACTGAVHRAAHLHQQSVADRDVTEEPGSPGAVDDGSVADDEIEHDFPPRMQWFQSPTTGSGPADRCGRCTAVPHCAS